MIDQRALQAAITEARDQFYGMGLHEDEELAIIIAIITAYEAALWRPIEEAPHVRPNIMVWIPTPTDPWNPDGLMLHGRDVAAPDKGAMFRTIDPPKQDEPKETPHALTE